MNDFTAVLAPFDFTGMEREFLLGMHRRMVQAREFEEQLYYLFLSRPMPGTMHQATGQEAVAVGIVSALAADDYVTSTHRGHAHCVAKGVPLDAMMAEMFARRTGSCRGMGGSMHLCDFSRGMLGAFGIVGAGIPIAAGAALSARVRGSRQVAVSFFGDGATNEGIFHETLNMASLWKLPAIFVIENNQYALSMRVQESSAMPNLAERGAAYAIPGMQVDGNNVAAVYQAAAAAVARARSGEGPTLIECITYRARGHARFEASGYRDAAEVERWKRLDPILRMAEALQNAGLATAAELAQIEAEVHAELEAAIAFAESSPAVEPEDYLQYITLETTHV